MRITTKTDSHFEKPVHIPEGAGIIALLSAQIDAIY